MFLTSWRSRASRHSPKKRINLSGCKITWKSKLPGWDYLRQIWVSQAAVKMPYSSPSGSKVSSIWSNKSKRSVSNTSPKMAINQNLLPVCVFSGSYIGIKRMWNDYTLQNICAILFCFSFDGHVKKHSKTLLYYIKVVITLCHPLGVDYHTTK